MISSLTSVAKTRALGSGPALFQYSYLCLCSYLFSFLLLPLQTVHSPSAEGQRFYRMSWQLLLLTSSATSSCSDLFLYSFSSSTSFSSAPLPFSNVPHMEYYDGLWNLNTPGATHPSLLLFVQTSQASSLHCLSLSWRCSLTHMSG